MSTRHSFLFQGLLSCGRTKADEEPWETNLDSNPGCNIKEDVAEVFRGINSDDEIPGHELPERFVEAMKEKGWILKPSPQKLTYYQQYINFEH